MCICIYIHVYILHTSIYMWGTKNGQHNNNKPKSWLSAVYEMKSLGKPVKNKRQPKTLPWWFAFFGVKLLRGTAWSLHLLPRDCGRKNQEEGGGRGGGEDGVC